jgi:hypothetical protein
MMRSFFFWSIFMYVFHPEFNGGEGIIHVVPIGGTTMQPEL